MWSGPARADADDHPNVLTWEGWDSAEHHQEYFDKHGEYPNFSIMGDEEEGFAKIRAGARYDVSHPCSYKVEIWRDAGIIQPIDVSRLGHWGDVVPSLKEIPGMTTADGGRLLRRVGMGPHFGSLSSRPRGSQVSGRGDLGNPVGRALCRAHVNGRQPHRRSDGGRNLRRRQGPLQHERRRSRGHRRPAAQATSVAALLLDQPHRYRERDGGGRTGGDQFMETTRSRPSRARASM